MDFDVFEQRYERKLMEKQAHPPQQPHTPCNSIPHVLHEHRCELTLLGKRLQAHIEQSILQKNEFASELSQLRESISEIRLKQTCAEKLQDSEDQGHNQLVDLHAASIIQRPSLPLPEPRGTGARSSNGENSDHVLRPDGVADIDNVVEVFFNRLGYRRNASVTTSPRHGGSFDTPSRASCSNACHTADFDPAGGVRPDETLQVVQPTMFGEPRLTAAPTADQHAASPKFELEGITTTDQGRCSSDTFDAAASDVTGKPPSEMQSSSSHLDESRTVALSGFRSSEASSAAAQKFRQLQKTVSSRRASFEYTADDYECARESWQLRQQMYQFQESAWDVGMFPFLPRMSHWNSLIVLFIFCFNTVAQNCLNLCIYANFVQGDIGEGHVEALRRWRITVAHDVRWMDKITQQSLARKVCNHGGSTGGLYMSGNVQDTLIRTLDYGPSQAFHKSSDGVLQKLLVDNRPESIGMFMCVMALFIWWSTCHLELRHWLDCCEGIIRIPRGPRTRLIILSGTEDLAFVNIHLLRKAWCAFVLVNRFLVAVILLYVGSMYLLRTLEIRDLILNAVALELILNLDELIYKALVPFHVRHFMHCLEPIPTITGRCFFSGIHYEIALTCSMLVVGTIVAVSHLLDQWRELKDARNAICDGYLDFVYSVDPGGAIVAAPTYVPEVEAPIVGSAPIAGRVGSLENNYQYKAVKEIISDWRTIALGPQESLSVTAASLSGSRSSLAERQALPLGERMAELNPICADLSISNSSMIWPSTFIVNMIREPLAKVGITVISDSVCVQARRMCSWDNETGLILRKWCAHSCGCDLPNSSLVLTKSSQGCPNSCAIGELYYKGLDNAACQDKSVSSPEFQNYLEGFRSMTESYSHIASWSSLLNMWMSLLQGNGCASHEFGAFGDLCGAVNIFELKPLHHICPVTCGCDRGPYFGISDLPIGQPELCPHSCENATKSHFHHPPDMGLHLR